MSLLLWLLILYIPLGLLQLFIYSRKSGNLVLYQRLLIMILFIGAEVSAAGYTSSLFFDLIRDKGLRCATGVVGLWALACGVLTFGLTLIGRSFTSTVSHRD